MKSAACIAGSIPVVEDLRSKCAVETLDWRKEFQFFHKCLLALARIEKSRQAASIVYSGF